MMCSGRLNCVPSALSYFHNVSKWMAWQRNGGLANRSWWSAWFDFDPLLHYPDGQLEPLPYIETAIEKRTRMARNHVRKLLRGRRWLHAAAKAPFRVGKCVVISGLKLRAPPRAVPFRSLKLDPSDQVVRTA